MRSPLSLLFMAISGCLMALVSAHGQEISFFRIGTGSAGGTYYPIGAMIANAISNPPGSLSCEKGGSCGVPGLVAVAQPTRAAVYNVDAIQAGDLEAGLSETTAVYLAFRGEGVFEGNPLDSLRIIAGLYPEDLHLVLPKGAQLGSLRDLEGKRVGIAEAGSGTQIAVERVLAAQGITRENIQEAEMNQRQSAEQLASGRLDAYFYTGGTPVAAMIQLDIASGMELYSFSETEMDSAAQAVPYYSPSQIPAGTYEGVDYDVNSMAVTAVLVTSAEQPEELVYEITRALWNDNTRALLDNGHAKGKVIQLESALQGLERLGAPLHPGAARFYREVGLLD